MATVPAAHTSATGGGRYVFRGRYFFRGKPNPQIVSRTRERLTLCLAGLNIDYDANTADTAVARHSWFGGTAL